MQHIKKIPRKYLIIIAVAALAAIIGTYTIIQLTNNNTGPPSNANDAAMFVAPNAARIENVRAWLMQPYNPGAQSFGYDNTTGMIAGGYWPGYGAFPNGYHNGVVLIDNNILLGRSLDYLNAQKGIKTTIDFNTRAWLSNTTFVNPKKGLQNGTYNGYDRREIFFGKSVPCVYVTGSQVWYAPGHLLSDPSPIVTALPSNCSQDSPNSLELFAPWIELDYIDHNYAQAQNDFSYTINNWTPTPGTGVGGSTGGYFSAILDPLAPCSTERVLALWIDAARATGYWNLNANSRTVAQQVVNELWGLQQSDGGIAASGGGPGCKVGQEIPEAGGEAILAFDPRVPSWFANTGTQGSTITQMINSFFAINSKDEN